MSINVSPQDPPTTSSTAITTLPQTPLDLSKLDCSVSETEQTQSSINLSQKEVFSCEPPTTDIQADLNDVTSPLREACTNPDTKNTLEDSSQNLGNSVVQEDRIDIFTSGMEQEFPLTDGVNVKSKTGEEQNSSLTSKENGKLESTLELSDKENDQKRTSKILDESSQVVTRVSSKHTEHHTHKDLREILTKNSLASNRNRDFEIRKPKKSSRTVDKYIPARDRESTQRHRRMYQEIKNTLTYSTASVVSQREIDPEREWEDKKREREIQRIEVERARKELETRRRQDSQSSQNSLKRSLTSYSQDTRPLTIEGGHSEYPIPPVVPPLPSEVAATRIARIQNLVRPFTQQQLKCMLELYGHLIVGTDTAHQYFWTDKNKTQCCCVYQNIESCEKARNALHGARWPSINPKNLNFSFLSIENYNELTGLGIDQEILDKTFQIVVEKEVIPPAPKVAKIQEKLRVKDRVKEKDRREKLKEREKNRERERESYKEVPKKIKKDITTNEPSEKRSTGYSTDKKPHSLSLKKEVVLSKPKESKSKITDEAIPQAPVKPHKVLVELPKGKEDVQKIPDDKQRHSEDKQNRRSSGEKHKVSEEKLKHSDESARKSPEKPKSSDKKLSLKRLPTKEDDTQPPQAKKAKETPAVVSDSEVDTDNYQCSGQAALLDTLFRKTVAEPCIYWLPLTEKQVKAKLKRKQLEAEKLESQKRPAKRKYSRSPKRKRK